MKLARLSAVAAAFALFVAPASADYSGGSVAVYPLPGAAAIPVSGTFSASLGGFTPSASGARMTPLTVTTSDSSQTLPTGAVVVVSNVGATNPMYCNVNGVAATTSDQLIGANSWFAFTIPAAITTLHCIATGGSTTANGLGGSGLPTGAGGGGGGSSSNASVNATGSAVPASATYVGMLVGGNLTGVPGTANGVKTDGSAVTQPVSGTVTANAGTNLNTSLLAVETGGNLATIAGAVTSSVVQSNTKQVNGVTTLAGAGATGTGSQRVTVAQDTTTLAGSAPIADNAAWTAGTTPQSPMGCEYTSGGATALVTAHMGTVGCTAARAEFTDKSSVAGTALSAAVSAYGTAPTGTEVEGVNAYVTNSNANGSNTSANSSPVVIASDQAAVAVKAASGAIASGAIASGAAVSGAFVAGSIADLAHGQGTMAASVPVAIASNQSSLTVNGGAASGGALTGNPVLVAGGNGTNAYTIKTDTSGDVFMNEGFVGGSAYALGSTTASASAPVVLASNQTAADPCMFQAKTNVAISTASGTAALVTGVSAKKIYIRSLALIAPSAVSVSLAEGSSATCGTSNQAAVIGVATNGTAANGMPLAANGGLTLGNGGGTVASTATNANYLCLFQSGTAQIAGNMTYVQQ